MGRPGVWTGPGRRDPRSWPMPTGTRTTGRPRAPGTRSATIAGARFHPMRPGTRNNRPVWIPNVKRVEGLDNPTVCKAYPGWMEGSTDFQHDARYWSRRGGWMWQLVRFIDETSTERDELTREQVSKQLQGHTRRSLAFQAPEITTQDQNKCRNYR